MKKFAVLGLALVLGTSLTFSASANTISEEKRIEAKLLKMGYT